MMAASRTYTKKRDVLYDDEQTSRSSCHLRRAIDTRSRMQFSPLRAHMPELLSTKKASVQGVRSKLGIGGQYSRELAEPSKLEVN